MERDLRPVVRPVSKEIEKTEIINYYFFIKHFINIKNNSIMRKHFLILMLLTLLPLAGWAQTTTFGEVGIGKFTYGDDAAPVPVVKDSEGAILTVGTHYEVEAGATTGIFTDEACTKEVATWSAMKADGTTYYRLVTGKGAYVGQVAHPHFTVAKAVLTLHLNANVLDRNFGTDPIAIKADGSQFTAAAIDGLKFTDAWPGIKKGDAPTYSTTSANKGTYSTADAKSKLTFAGGWTPDNYTITYDGELEIFARNISATAQITAEQGNVVYTGYDIIGAYTVLDKKGGVTLVADKDYTVSVAHNVVANIKPTITFKGNYSGAIDAVKGFAVTPAPIVVSVEDVEAVYDGTDQADQTAKAKFSYSGIVGDDIANAANIKSHFKAPTVLAVDGEAINVGTYELLMEEDATTGTETNYTISGYVPATLTITAAPLAIKAKDASKSFGEADPTFVVNPVLGLTITGVTFTRDKAGTEEGEAAGEYDITPDISAIVVKSGKTVVTDNYNITVDKNKGKLTIGKGKIYVTIKDAEKFYGQADPAFTYAVTGLKGDDKLAAFDITREAGEAVKGYSLTATVANPNTEKYSEVVVAPGILTIKKAQLELSCDAFSLVKGATDKQKAAALNMSLIKVTGINNSDKAANLFDLAYDGGVDFANDNTDADGVVLTLKATKLITENATDYKVADLYEIVTNKATDPWTVSNTTNFKLIVGAGTDVAQAYTSVDTDVDEIVEHAGETQDVTIKFAPRNARELPAGTARKWKAGQWTTMVLPFDISVAELSQVLGYAIVNVINPERTKVSGTKSEFYGKLTMKGGNGSDEVLKANKPFLVKIAEDMIPAKAYNFGAKKLVKPTDLSVNAGEGCKFVGTYTTKTVTKDDDAAIWFMLGDLANWAYIGTTSSATWDIVPFEAYIDMSAVPAAARNLVFYAEELDGSVTAIKGINSSNASDAKQNAEGWYNLNGVKLQGAPSQKGIYINNGKKVVIK